MRPVKITVGLALLAAATFSTYAVANSSYKVSFFENGRWKGDATVYESAWGQCTIQVYFCPWNNMFYACADSQTKALEARNKGWDYKVTGPTGEYCRNR